MQWWVQSPAGPRQLEPQLDRHRPDFYDYTADEWYTVPAARGRAPLSDPCFDDGAVHRSPAFDWALLVAAQAA